MEDGWAQVRAGNYSNGQYVTGWYPLEKMQQWEATDADLSNDVPVAAGKMVIITSGEADTTLTLPNPMAAQN